MPPAEIARYQGDSRVTAELWVCKMDLAACHTSDI